MFVHVHTHDGDREETDRATRQLQRELLALDVDDVRPAPEEGPAPSGAKGDAVTVGTLLVDLANSAGLAALFQMIASWVSRGPGRSITVKDSDGGELTLEGGTRDQHQQLINDYLSKRPEEDGRDGS